MNELTELKEASSVGFLISKGGIHQTNSNTAAKDLEHSFGQVLIDFD